jgi:hypothetical protein
MAIQTALTRRATAGVVFIEPRHAMVARTTDATPVVFTLDRDDEAREAFLGRIAREIEDCREVVVLGPERDRLAFEREYVSLYQRPDRLVHEESLARATALELLLRVERLEQASRAD